MKKKFFIIITGSCLMLYTLGNKTQLHNNTSILTLANVEALAAHEESSEGACKGLSSSGYGKYYSLHEISCIIEGGIGKDGVNFERGVKNKCKLEQPCNPNASCSSNMEKACHKTN